MTRPLMQHGVGQLEEMFAKGKADPKVLKQLEQELQYRHVSRAVALLTEVQAAMCEGVAVPQTSTMPVSPLARATTGISQQSDLWGHPDKPPVVPIPAPIRTVTPESKPQEFQLVAKSPAPRPTMPVEDAYKVLKITPGATWESIEQARYTLVDQSHPLRWKELSADKRDQALAAAKRVNAAYVVLSQIRCSGR